MSMRVETSSLNAGFYVRREEGCTKIEYTGFSIREMLGVNNGNSPAISIAIEELAPKASSPPHRHVKGEECQLVIEGRGKLFVGNQTKEITAGDLVKIPAGKVHYVFNENQGPLKLLCFVSPAWTIEDTVFTDNASSASEENSEIYMRRKKGCTKINAAPGETIFELVGKENGALDNFSVAIVKIEGGHSTDAHFHPEAEESYIILKGEGTLIMDGKDQVVTPGDLVKIPAGKVHQIFNKTKETLKFYCVCTPAWTPNCMIKV